MCLKSKTKSYQPRRNNVKKERTFQQSIWKPSKVTNKPITKIITSQLDNKIGQFLEEEFKIVLTKIKNRKTVGVNEIPPKIWTTRKFEMEK